MEWFGSDAWGQVLDPGRVPDCYLGLLLPPPSAGEPKAGRVLVVGPAALLHPHVPQPAGSFVYELLTGHPEREPHELVFLADLTGELRAWPRDTWAAVGIDPDAVAHAVIACWRRGEVQGLEFEGVSFAEARALARPAMTVVRGQLRARLAGRVHRASWRWLHPTSGHRPGDTFLLAAIPGWPPGRRCPSGCPAGCPGSRPGVHSAGRRCPVRCAVRGRPGRSVSTGVHAVRPPRPPAERSVQTLHHPDGTGSDRGPLGRRGPSRRVRTGRAGVHGSTGATSPVDPHGLRGLTRARRGRGRSAARSSRRRTSGPGR